MNTEIIERYTIRLSIVHNTAKSLFKAQNTNKNTNSTQNHLLSLVYNNMQSGNTNKNISP